LDSVKCKFGATLKILTKRQTFLGFTYQKLRSAFAQLLSRSSIMTVGTSSSAQSVNSISSELYRFIDTPKAVTLRTDDKYTK
jgi:hypothetical protein